MPVFVTWVNHGQGPTGSDHVRDHLVDLGARSGHALMLRRQTLASLLPAKPRGGCDSPSRNQSRRSDAQSRSTSPSTRPPSTPPSSSIDDIPHLTQRSRPHPYTSLHIPQCVRRCKDDRARRPTSTGSSPPTSGSSTPSVMPVVSRGLPRRGRESCPLDPPHAQVRPGHIRWAFQATAGDVEPPIAQARRDKHEQHLP